MNDEIKEIKENIKPTLEWLKECSEYNWIFETSNSSELFNYITNLQQENEIKTTKLNAIRKYLLNNKLYTFKYDDEELFEITTDKKAKDDLLKILGDENDNKTNN